MVKNWTHSNTLGRISIKVAVSYDCDAEKVMEILNACVAEHPGVLKQPPPAVQLTEFGAPRLDLRDVLHRANLSIAGGSRATSTSRSCGRSAPPGST